MAWGKQGEIAPIRSLRGATALRTVPWLLPLVAIAGALVALDVPAAGTATYGGYFVAGLVLPGVLLMRATWRSTGNWAEDAAVGVVFGLAYELAGWALFTALGWRDVLLLWPLLAISCFAAVPGLRRYWRIAEPRPLPAGWSWGVALLCTASLLVSAVWAMAPHLPPPDGIAYYPDLLYHLSLVQELARSVPPEIPQVTGEPLQYHWFSDAHLAAASDITGQSPAMVLFRLWLLPFWLTGLVVFAALARTVCKSWWAGLLAVAITGFVQYVGIWSIRAGRMNGPFNMLSPSQTVAVVVTAVVSLLLIDLVRGRRPGPAGWAALVALCIHAGGSKPTALPLLLGGTGLATLAVWRQTRRPPWRLIAVCGLLCGAGVATMLTVSGSTGGSRLQAFAAIKGALGYKVATGDTSLRAAPGTWLIESLADGDQLARLGAVLLIAALLVSQLGLLVGLAVVATRSTRRDPVAWWLAGAIIAGWLGFLLLAHPSGSESYFVATTTPFSAAAVCWLAISGLRGRSRRTVLAVGGTGAVLGLGLVLAGQLVPETERRTRADRIALLGYPMLALAVLAALAVAGWLVARRRRTALVGLGWSVVVATVLAMTVPYIGYATGRVVTAGSYPGRPLRTVAYAVSPDEQRAAGWLGAHSGRDDVVVTNTACRPARRQPPGCDARGYIVTGIAGRRSLLEGWGYTEQAHRHHGDRGVPYTAVAAPWPDRADLVRRLFTDPAPADLAELRRRGVRWIYADRAAGPVPAALDRLAVPRHSEPTVRIYEIPVER